MDSKRLQLWRHVLTHQNDVANHKRELFRKDFERVMGKLDQDELQELEEEKRGWWMQEDDDASWIEGVSHE